MIYTVTLNPALDYIADVPDFRMHRTNRTVHEEFLLGGKGINVSAVLKNLGMTSIALGFTAGFTGEEIRRRVRESGLLEDFIFLPKGESRINFKLKGSEGTEINAHGPEIDSESFDALKAQLQSIKRGDVLILSGSLPSGMADDTYAQLLDAAEKKNADGSSGILTIVDASGEALRQSLAKQPFLIKPNREELAALCGQALCTERELLQAAKSLQQLGARNVLVSLAGEGAVLCAEDGTVLRAYAPKGRLVNSVGAGDSMVAGFLCGWLRTRDRSEALRMGTAAGSASAFSEGFAQREETEQLAKEIHISELA